MATGATGEAGEAGLDSATALLERMMADARCLVLKSNIYCYSSHQWEAQSTPAPYSAAWSFHFHQTKRSLARLCSDNPTRVANVLICNGKAKPWDQTE